MGLDRGGWGARVLHGLSANEELSAVALSRRPEPVTIRVFLSIAFGCFLLEAACGRLRHHEHHAGHARSDAKWIVGIDPLSEVVATERYDLSVRLRRALAATQSAAIQPWHWPAVKSTAH